MSDLFDGIGTASEGGLFARALEPDSGAKRPHPDQPDACRNCGTELTGAYCQACGQRGHLHRTIGAFVHELLHGALHFEGKFWRTLPMLVFRPGKLTRRYIDGERARFVSPMALFLFTVFLMFAIFQMLGITAPADLDRSGVDTARTAAVEALAEARTERDALAQEGSSEAAENLDDRIDKLNDAIRQIDEGENYAFTGKGGNTFSQQINLTGIDFIDRGIVKKWRTNPSLMLYKLQANGYKFSWLLIPISIPFVWLLFAWKRRFKAYDHAIFVTYSISFVTLMFIVTSALVIIGPVGAVIAGFLPLVVPVHLYKQLRHAYGLSRFSAFWRLMVLSVFIWIVVILFLQVLLMLGAF
ncbi:DUF3667 domain-containing protein [Aurantiacibacter aquimixticola]|uniref:DUF3667 domain-containing protein n=1 Tax=Aurantiacibacter aquimixticola TaxID=1958945 RepID=A0A419RU46_9SPHN|nr:DUF3667 domain-containing protein [Aurantiacibacter aquimixticola]RJY09299.1 DUF3667 domain-containing protein [Aurantiacibacter aquimixticola]